MPDKNMRKCPNCNGDGTVNSKKDGTPYTCGTCLGQGQLPLTESEFEEKYGQLRAEGT